MITKEAQAKVIDALEQALDITDVYFHKGKLYVINEYDVEAVEEFLDETSWGADVIVVAPEIADFG